MAAIACLGQPDEGFDRTVAAPGIDRPPEVRDRLRTLLLDKLGDWNPFEHRIKSRCGVEALLDQIQLVTGEWPVLHPAGIRELEMPKLDRGHDIAERRGVAGSVAAAGCDCSAPSVKVAAAAAAALAHAVTMIRFIALSSRSQTPRGQVLTATAIDSDLFGVTIQRRPIRVRIRIVSRSGANPRYEPAEM